MVGGLGYWRVDNPWLQWWLRSVTVFCSRIAYCLPTGWHRNSVSEENWWCRYCLVSTVTTILTIGAFPLATFGLGMVGSLCYRRADNPRLQWWLRSVSVFCSGRVFCLPTGRSWKCVNGEICQWRWYLISTFTTILSIGHRSFPTGDLCSWHDWELVLLEN